MPIDFMCPCGKSFQVDDAMAGKRGRCKACGNVLAIPDPIDPATIGLALDDDDIPDASPPPLPPLPAAPPPRRVAVALPEPEPWYYGFLGMWSVLLLWLAAFLGVGSVFVLLFLVNTSGPEFDRLTKVVVSMFSGGIACVTTAATIALFVDIGRSLRRANNLSENRRV